MVVHFLSLEELRRTQKALNDSQALVLQTKKDHVRFISHGASHISFGFICYEYIVSLSRLRPRSRWCYIPTEIRTPLNSAIAGMQVLDNHFKAPAATRGDALTDGDLAEMVSDVFLSCTAAVDILVRLPIAQWRQSMYAADRANRAAPCRVLLTPQNDLLTFDKLESGSMELHKEPVCPHALVRNSMQIFQVQAKAKGETPYRPRPRTVPPCDFPSKPRPFPLFQTWPWSSSWSHPPPRQRRSCTARPRARSQESACMTATACRWTASRSRRSCATSSGRHNRPRTRTHPTPPTLRTHCSYAASDIVFCL